MRVGMRMRVYVLGYTYVQDEYGGKFEAQIGVAIEAMLTVSLSVLSDLSTLCLTPLDLQTR